MLAPSHVACSPSPHHLPTSLLPLPLPTLPCLLCSHIYLLSVPASHACHACRHFCGAGSWTSLTYATVPFSCACDVLLAVWLDRHSFAWDSGGGGLDGHGRHFVGVSWTFLAYTFTPYRHYSSGVLCPYPYQAKRMGHYKTFQDWMDGPSTHLHAT